MSYRILRRDELEELEPQFVRYLAAQGIDAELWSKIKVTDEGRAEQLLSGFSQMVFEDVLGRAQYLEQRFAKQLLCYRAGPEQLHLRGIIVQGEAPGVDLTADVPAEVMMQQVQAHGASVKLLTASRSYRQQRSQDLYELLEQGAKIAPTAELYDLLDSLAKPSTS